jgi:uncharacterized paraquat-inducible protein A
VNARNRIALLLTILAIVVLVPGLFKPVLTITASMELFGQTREIFSETRSIIGAIRALHDSGNDFVAGLILLFSVLVPFIKAALTLPMFVMRDAAKRYRLYLFVRSISKWSMADVFAVGAFIALLAAKATDNMDAIAGPGFYWFAAYCLVSNAAFQMLQIDPPPSPAPPAHSGVAAVAA